MSEENKNASSYSADNIQVLEGLEAVRKRPSMYIGDTGVKGLHHLVYEVVDNSIDEAVAGYCTDIFVTIHKDNSISVKDNGRGIPTGINKKENKSALEIVMTVLHAGGKFDKDTYKVSGGLHGVGVSCVNALSIHLSAVVHRDGKVFQQEYEKGKPLYTVKEIGESDATGTIVTFTPDSEIFTTTTTYNYDTLASRLRELSFLNKGITLSLTDERETLEDGNLRQDVFLSEGGLQEFVQFLDSNRHPIIPHPIYVEGIKQGIPVELALQYNETYTENVHSYVNNINTIEGGSHVAGFRRGLTRTLKAYADRSGLLKNLKVEITGDDFREGLTAVISVKVAEPQFEGQTKTKLGNSEVMGAVDVAVGEILNIYLEENPREAKAIVQKVVIAAQARAAARKARDLVQRKTVMGGSGLPGKLADCQDNDPTKCEIYFVEGDSAGGTAKSGRDRKYQAIMPLRGKILNVEKAMEHKIYENEEIKNMFTALGVSLGTPDDPKALNLDKLRYHRIIIMTDADVDGSHITTLILTFYFRYMKELIEKGYIYIATPPLYLVKKGKDHQYAWTEDQRLNAIQQLKGGGKEDSVHVQRYKGLGEMNAEQLWDTTMNPETRTLRQVNIENAAECDRIFSMLMGDEVAPRREFIERNSRYAKIDI
ncbi:MULTISPECIES: DNA topoisomerase (ATP-hydrolyzing) subunit B [unclassified Sphingobacterium]|uniref:DNA topoisomerase (ATP-hydrolyzing) subunit B n=1 Tax=unclassified Sphingobacterium TaxID=2609468 RepID=UPI0010487C35|nr:MULTISPECIES: DNA topoisomerase (ATP-hydrolyzing) subunit B [unclassified Sphingobacterium]MCS3555990.1 DNA gyrase subunit B [Sphingobacterium sp. JUb21]TCR00270.1 DNA gyrase subunit B [Sphingobacterium sp. JUb20]